MPKARKPYTRKRKVRITALSIILACGGVCLIQFRHKQRIGKNDPGVDGEGKEVLRLVPHHGPLAKSLRFTEKETEVNAEAVQRNRNVLETQCNGSLDDSSSMEEMFVAPASLEHEGLRHPKPCKFVFLDFGANVGDSLGKLIDAGFTGCPISYSVPNGRMEVSSTPITKRKLSSWIQSKVADFERTHTSRRKSGKVASPPVYPENYCYFGIEGNPTFTEQLQQLERRVMLSQPRPLRLAHMFTETVGSGAGDGPTTLYLDTVNGKNNFFGSSLLPDHTDVRNSRVNGKPVGVPVQGLTLSTLLRKTVVPRAGAHVLVKIDVEGAEYALMNEAYDSKALCDLAASGVRLDIRVEIHPKATIGENSDLDRFKNDVRFKLIKCGVNVEVAGDAG